MRSNKSRRRRKKEIYLVPFFSRSAFAIFIFVYNERRRHPLIAATTMLSTDIGNRAVFAAERDFYRTTSSCIFFSSFFFVALIFLYLEKLLYTHRRTKGVTHDSGVQRSALWRWFFFLPHAPEDPRDSISIERRRWRHVIAEYAACSTHIRTRERSDIRSRHVCVCVYERNRK